jgi:acetylornithine deacetylase
MALPVLRLLMNNTTDILYQEAVNVLSELIRLPSFSKEEGQTASYLFKYFVANGVEATQVGNNVIALNQHFDQTKPTILLNSHHDTVKPNSAYTNNPFDPIVKDGKLHGLGSNDAGGCLVSLLMAFLHFYKEKKLRYNLAFIASAEEEISGLNGIKLALEHVPAIDFGIVGEPTLMQMAVAERGLMVLDCKADGIAGHAARNEGENAIYKAMKDISWFQSYSFEKESQFLGPVKMSITSIETANKAHNIVPAECRFVVDVRLNELYTMEEVLQTIRQNVQGEVVPRSTRLRSTSISMDHPIVKAGLKLGKSTYGSPTTSDKALMPFPAVKMGPGDSARSHTADEFIYLEEIKNGINDYIQILNSILQ